MDGNVNEPRTVWMEQEKYRDDYERAFSTYEPLKDEVREMEQASNWIPGFMSKELAIDAISGPIMAMDVSSKMDMDYDLVYDTADTGTSLYVTLPDGQSKCIRGSGKVTLFERAGIFGSALGRESPEDLARTLGMALRVARGPVLILERWGKVSAFHSDAAGGYRIMAISDLLGVTEQCLGNRFGDPVFRTGYNSNSYTEAIWLLPDVQEELVSQYEVALRGSFSAQADISDLMPAVRFSASDTASSSACLQPLFLTKRGIYLRLSDGIKVKHMRSSRGLDGIELYEQSVKELLYTRFIDAIEAVERLGKIEIWHPENVVVGLCNKLRIPKRYGDSAREQVETFMVNVSCLSAHDVFLSLSEAVGDAQQKGASRSLVAVLEERLFAALSMSFDWKALDVGGVVAWGSPSEN